MDLLLMLLAQGAPDVNKAIDWAARASQLGVAGLALFIMFGALFVTWWTWRKNGALMTANASLEREFRAAEKAFREEARALEKQFRDEVKELLREMLDRGEDGQESQRETTRAVQDMTQAIQQLATRVEYVERTIHRLSRGSDSGGVV